MNSTKRNKLSVGHFRRRFLPKTETFIYNCITAHETYNPFVAGIQLKNLQNFPFEPRHIFLEMSRSNPRFWLYGGLAKLGLLRISRTYYREVIQQQEPDILHAHFGPEGVKLCPYRSSTRPLVTSFYGADASKLINLDKSIQAKYHSLFDTGDIFLVEGPSMRQKLLHLGCPEEKIVIQRIAVDTDRINPNPPTPDNTWRILMVGRFVEKKGFPDGIRAFAIAFGNLPDAELRIVGGGGSGRLSQSSLKQMAADNGVLNETTFLGYLDYDEYLKELAECDILLAPSKTSESGDSEGGAPTVLLEAQASAKPIVATTHADIPYVVENGAAGKLATPGSVDEIVDCMQWFRDHAEELPHMGRRGRASVERRHNVSMLIKKLESQYDSLLP